MAILTDLRDPRIQNVTVTYVEVTPDLRTAKVHVSVMGDEAAQNLSIKGLQNASGFLQQKIGNRIDTRYIPRLKFELDQGVKHSIEVARILDEVLEPPAGTKVIGTTEDADSEPESDQGDLADEKDAD